jgi:stress response protein SCP2
VSPMKSMFKGSNLAVATEAVRVVVAWRSGPDIPDVDVFAALLSPAGKTRSASDFVYFDRAADLSGSVRHNTKQYAGRGSASDSVTVDLGHLESTVERVVVGASTDGGAFAEVTDLRFYLYSGTKILAQFDIREAGAESALIGGELYRRAGGWKFRAVGQGYSSGLLGLATDFGIRLDPEAARAVRAQRNRARSRLGELETAARMRAEAQLGDLTSRTSAGRLHLGAIKWATGTGQVCDWTTDQLIDNPAEVAVAAAFPVLDQGGMPVDLYARIQLDPADPRRKQTPEQQVLAVSFGSHPVTASGEVTDYLPKDGKTDVVIGAPEEMDAALAEVRRSSDRSAWRWLPRWAGGEDDDDRESDATTPATTPAESAHPMDPVRAILRTVILPPAVATKLEALIAVLLHNLQLADALELSGRDRHTLEQTASSYLPECLTAYRDATLVLPKDAVLTSGRTVEGELLHALTVLQGLVDSAMNEVRRGASSNLMAFSSFLEDKSRG